MRRVNVKFLVYLSGIVLLIESGFMAFCLFVTLFFETRDFFPMLMSMLVTALTGGAAFLSTRKSVKKNPSIREGFLFVSTIWIIISLFGALPYIFSGSIPYFVDAYFETISGFTTTGSSILIDIEALSREVLFWRALTHWMGGMGIIVLVIVVLPSLKAGGIHLFSAESTKVSLDDVHLRVLDTAKRFGIIYVSITVIETIVLLLGGMNLFESLSHAFATVATGGFSPKNTSIAGYSPYIQYVIIIFMYLSGINFNIHFLIGKGNLRTAFRNQELRLYTTFILLFSGVLFLVLMTHGYHWEWALRSSSFQVVSIITCTGFVTDDYLLWPHVGVLLIFLAMFVGASAGSTGGGIKVVRHLLMFKNVIASVKSALHPRTIFVVRYQNKPVSEGQLQSIIAFYFWYLLIFFGAALFLIMFGTDFFTSIGAVATTLGGIGPGLGKVGPVSNFSDLPDFIKIFLTFIMLIGRLEIYAFITLFSPAFWRR